MDARLEPAERDLRDGADPAERRRITLALAAHHRVERGARAHRPVRRHARTRGGHDGARRPRRGRLLLLRRPVADALGATGSSSSAVRRASTSAARPAASSACWRPPIPSSSGTAAIPIRARSAWARGASARASASSTAPRLRGCRSATRRSTSSTRSRSGATSPRGRRSTGSTRCAACCGRAGACCSRPTASTRWPTLTASASAHRSSWQRSADSLGERGFWYTPEYEGIGDHGIANPDWGIAFLTAEWLLARATPKWRVALFHPGRVEANHDLYVLERR